MKIMDILICAISLVTNRNV